MRLAPVTGLFGTNSSGKTSILQLLLLLRQTVESPDRSQVLNFGGQNTLVSLGGFRNIVREHDTSSELGWEISWQLAKRLQIPDPEKKGQALLEGNTLTYKASLSETRQGLGIDELVYAFGGQEFRLARKKDTSKYSLTSPTGFSLTRTRGRAWDLPAPVKC